MACTKEPLLSVENACVEINGTPLVSEVSFQVQAGEILVIIGPNGAGKSSLLKALNGELKLSSGNVSFAGRSICDWPLNELATMRAMQSQFNSLNFPFRVEEVIALGRSPHASGKTIDQTIIDTLINKLDLAHLKDRIYPQLSGGEKQRTHLARVLAQIWRREDAEDRLLILDEPTASLDLGHQQQLIKLLKEFASTGAGIVLVVHDLNTAAKVADKLLLMCCGEARAFGSPEDVLQKELLENTFAAELRIIREPSADNLVILS